MSLLSRLFRRKPKPLPSPPGLIEFTVQLNGCDEVMATLAGIEGELDRLLEKYDGVTLPTVNVTINNYTAPARVDMVDFGEQVARACRMACHA